MPSGWLFIYIFSVVIFFFLMGSWSTFYYVNPNFSKVDLKAGSTTKFW